MHTAGEPCSTAPRRRPPVTSLADLAATQGAPPGQPDPNRLPCCRVPVSARRGAPHAVAGCCRLSSVKPHNVGRKEYDADEHGCAPAAGSEALGGMLGGGLGVGAGAAAHAAETQTRKTCRAGPGVSPPAAPSIGPSSAGKAAARLPPGASNSGARAGPAAAMSSASERAAVDARAAKADVGRLRAAAVRTARWAAARARGMASGVLG